MIMLHNPVSLSLPPSLKPNLNLSALQPRLRFQCHCRPEWATNAKSVRPGRFGPKGSGLNRGVEEEEEKRETFDKGEKRKWWSDYSNDDYDSLDDDYDDFDMFDDWSDEPIWDKFWILKVLKSYGYFLPVIIGSMLLATGPKAFLMALALPLGQSALSILIDNIWGKKEREKPRRRSKNRGPFARPNRRMFYGREESREEGNNNNKRGYRSWVSSGNGDAYGGTQRSGLGGWDELDESYERGETVSKLSKRRRYKEVPLFMRLLVAVFPFLGSWFRIL